MRWMLVVAVTMLGLAGCAAPVWTRPNTTQEQFQKDKQECWYEGSKATASDQNVFAGLMTSNLAEQCMQVRGYTKK